MKEVGMYYGPDESDYRSMRDIKNRQGGPIKRSPDPSDYKEFSLTDWTQIFSRRQSERQEAVPEPNRLSIDFHTDQPVFVACIGDIHASGHEVDYDRLHDEVLALQETDGAYAMLMGDLVNNFFWGEAKEDDLGNTDEEHLYAQALFEELQGKLLCAWMGNHEQWSNKMGVNLYHRFMKDTGATLFNGVSYVTMDVGDQQYKLAGSHQFGGFSIYNNAHSARRVYQDEAQGADICVTAHTHKKGYMSQPMKTFDGEKQVHFLSVGAYKAGDSYSRKRGWSAHEEDGMGGLAFTLYPDQKHVEVHYDIRTGLDRFRS